MLVVIDIDIIVSGIFVVLVSLFPVLLFAVIVVCPVLFVQSLSCLFTLSPSKLFLQLLYSFPACGRLRRSSKMIIVLCYIVVIFSGIIVIVISDAFVVDFGFVIVFQCSCHSHFWCDRRGCLQYCSHTPFCCHCRSFFCCSFRSCPGAVVIFLYSLYLFSVLLKLLQLSAGFNY